MRERPVLFSAPMVRAILDGTKTQTRRIVNPSGAHECDWMCSPFRDAEGRFLPPVEWNFGRDGVGPSDPANFYVDHRVACPYGVPGDRLWDGINGERAPWESNPWVWAVSFRRVQP